MACFVVPAAEAVVTTIVGKALEAKERKSEGFDGEHAVISAEKAKNNFSRKLKWLSNMLWGGSLLLAFEHVWHGEVTVWFPFLTAASNAADTAAMLHEMATVGVSMALVVTAVWGVMVMVSSAIEKRAAAEGEAAR